MPFPQVRVWLICETVRSESNNKLSLLGVYGIAPDVEILLENFSLPTSLAFVAFAEPGAEGTFNAQYRILDEGGTPIVESPFAQVVIQRRDRPSSLAFGMIGVRFQREGQHIFRLSVDGQHVSDAVFRARQALPGEISRVLSVGH